MEITLNGTPTKLDNTDNRISIKDLLDLKGFDRKFIAIAKNKNHIPKSNYGDTYICAGDQVEILSPIYGG